VEYRFSFRETGKSRDWWCFKESRRTISIFSCLVEIKDSNEAEVIAVRKAMEISAPSTLAQEVHWIF
jgi:hypothetical protein